MVIIGHLREEVNIYLLTPSDLKWPFKFKTRVLYMRHGCVFMSIFCSALVALLLHVLRVLLMLKKH